MRIIVPTAGVVIGATAAAITYVVVAESGNAVAKATHYGSFVASKIAGTGIRVLFGTASGMVAEYATVHGGQEWLAPLITGGSRRAAMISAAAVGAAAVALTTVIYYGASWVWGRSSKALSNVMRQPPTEVTAKLIDAGGDFQSIELPPPSPTEIPSFPAAFPTLPEKMSPEDI
jgi:hypothetical protein